MKKQFAGQLTTTLFALASVVWHYSQWHVTEWYSVFLPFSPFHLLLGCFQKIPSEKYITVGLCLCGWYFKWIKDFPFKYTYISILQLKRFYRAWFYPFSCTQIYFISISTSFRLLDELSTNSSVNKQSRS